MIRFLSACLICTVLYAQPRLPILETTFRNPAHAATAEWARGVCGGQKYFVNVFPPNEWMQVLHPDSEIDDEVVGASGVAVTPKLAGGDVPSPVRSVGADQSRPRWRFGGGREARGAMVRAGQMTTLE